MRCPDPWAPAGRRAAALRERGGVLPRRGHRLPRGPPPPIDLPPTWVPCFPPPSFPRGGGVPRTPEQAVEMRDHWSAYFVEGTASLSQRSQPPQRVISVAPVVRPQRSAHRTAPPGDGGPGRRFFHELSGARAAAACGGRFRVGWWFGEAPPPGAVFPLWSFPNGTRTGGGVSGPGLCGLSLKNGVGEDPQGPGSVKTPHGVARGPRPPYSPCAAARRHLAGGPAAPSRGAGRGVPGGGRRGPRRPPPHRHRLPCGRKGGGRGSRSPRDAGGGGRRLPTA